MSCVICGAGRGDPHDHPPRGVTLEAAQEIMRKDTSAPERAPYTGMFKHTSMASLSRWSGIAVDRLWTDPDSDRITLDNGDHIEFEVGLVCHPQARCCPPNDGDGTRWMSPSYSPFTDPAKALEYARWQANHVYGSEHTPVLRARVVSDYEVWS